MRSALGTLMGVFVWGCSPSAKQLPPENLTLPVFDGSLPAVVPPADASQPTRVVVRGANGPEANVTVVYQDAKGAVLGTDLTDVAGRTASFVPPSGGQVTVLFGTSASLAVLTYVGIVPGDLLVAIDPADASLPSAQVAALPSPPPVDAGAGLYYSAISGPCAYFGAVPTLPTPPYSLFFPSCVNPLGQFPVLFVAQDSYANPLAYTFGLGNNASTDGGTTNVAITQPWSTSFGSWTVNIANVTEFTGIAFSEVANDVMQPQLQTVFSSADGGAQAVSFMTHPGYAGVAQTEAHVLVSSMYNTAVALTERVSNPPANGTSSFDVAKLPPNITSVTTDTTNPAQPVINWVWGAPPSMMTGQIATLSWENLGDAGYSSTSWTVVVAPTATSATFPVLPASAGAWSPATNLYFNTPAVSAYGGDGITSYDAFRALAAAFLFPPTSGGPTVPVLPFDGAGIFSSCSCCGE